MKDHCSYSKVGIVIVCIVTPLFLYYSVVVAPSRLDHGQLIKELRGVVDWFQLGIHLGIDHSDLKKIEADCRGNVERCKAEMLSLWIDNLNVSMEKLTRALEGIGHRNLARQLQDKHNVPQEGKNSVYTTTAVCVGACCMTR